MPSSSWFGGTEGENVIPRFPDWLPAEVIEAIMNQVSISDTDKRLPLPPAVNDAFMAEQAARQQPREDSLILQLMLNQLLGQSQGAMAEGQTPQWNNTPPVFASPMQQPAQSLPPAIRALLGMY